MQSFLQRRRIHQAVKHHFENASREKADSRPTESLDKLDDGGMERGMNGTH